MRNMPLPRYAAHGIKTYQMRNIFTYVWFLTCMSQRRINTEGEVTAAFLYMLLCLEGTIQPIALRSVLKNARRGRDIA